MTLEFGAWDSCFGGTCPDTSRQQTYVETLPQSTTSQMITLTRQWQCYLRLTFAKANEGPTPTSTFSWKTSKSSSLSLSLSGTIPLSTSTFSRENPSLSFSAPGRCVTSTCSVAHLFFLAVQGFLKEWWVTSACSSAHFFFSAAQGFLKKLKLN